MFVDYGCALDLIHPTELNSNSSPMHCNILNIVREGLRHLTYTLWLYSNVRTNSLSNLTQWSVEWRANLSLVISVHIIDSKLTCLAWDYSLEHQNMSMCAIYLYVYISLHLILVSL